MDMSEYELGWLAGIIDGEGCLYARFLISGGVRRSSMEVRLTIHTVSKPMLDALEGILKKLEVEFKRLPPKMQPKSKRPAGKINIHKKKSLLRLLDIISPFLIVKKAEALRTLKYLRKSTVVSQYKSDTSDLNLPIDLQKLKLIA